MTYSLIFNGTLIDGNGRSPLKDAAILIKNNQIVQVGRKREINLPDADIQKIDAAGGHILPGLIDTHVHLMFNEINMMQAMMTPFSYNFYDAISNFRNTVEAGITSVRDAGGSDLGVQKAIDNGLVLGPRTQISISVLTITGGHGDGWLPSGSHMDIFSAYPGNPDGMCDGVEEVRKKVREVLRAGAQVIKVCSTGGVLSPTDHPEFTQFTQEELEVMVQEGAYRRGVKVMAHAQGAEGIKNAVRAGIHSIEHGILLDDEAIEVIQIF